MEFIQSLSIILASWSVLYGIGAWRREHTGKRKIELAEETLALFYEASDAIKSIRCPMSNSSETDNVEKEDRETYPQFEARKKACVVYNRYERHKELFSKIHAMRYRFMAQVGTSEAEPFDDLRKVMNEILGSAHSLTRLWAREHFTSDKDRESHFEMMQKYEAVFWEVYSDDKDPINPKVEKLTRKIELTCQSIIEGKGTLYSLLNKKIGKSS